jgi:hypothetical protein
MTCFARHSRRDTISTRFSTPSDINIPDQHVITRHRRPPLECGRHFDRFEPEFQNRGLTSLKDETQMAGNLIPAVFPRYSPPTRSTKSRFARFCFARHPILSCHITPCSVPSHSTTLTLATALPGSCMTLVAIALASLLGWQFDSVVFWEYNNLSIQLLDTLKAD